MRMREHDGEAIPLAAVDRPLEPFDGPGDKGGRAVEAVGMGDRHHLANHIAAPVAGTPGAQQDRRRLEPIPGEKVVAKQAVMNAGDRERRAGRHSPASFSRDASTSANWVTTLSVSGSQGWPGR